jgi:predicted RND superfamily exporter protein
MLGDKIINGIVKHHKLVTIIFALMVAVSIFLSTGVKTNFDLSSYIPEEADSTVALEKMQEEFGEALPNVEVAMPNMTVSEALAFKEKLLDLDSVSGVLWLDDQLDLAVPLDLQDQATVESFYKDSVALYQVTADKDNAAESLESLRETAGEEGAIRGQIVELAEAQQATQSEITRIMLFAVPMALVILIIATKSWFEPFLFLLVVFVGVFINLGTNIIFSEISFITQSVAAILQLAVTMDYAIFFLHRTNEYKAEGDPLDVAVKKSMKKSFQPVSSSAATTLFGFLALVFMRFKLGPDLSLVLAKGVVLSLITVFVLLPALIMLTDRIIEKTTHRSLLPSFKGLAKVVTKLAIPILIIVALIIVPVFLGQRANNFLYGMGSYAEGSRAAEDAKMINEKFGNNMQMALLVPRDRPAKEEIFIERLEEMPEIKSVISFISMTSAAIPPDLISEELTSQLLSDDFSRMIVVSNSPAESPETFALAEHIRELSAEIYNEGEEVHLVGENFIMTDMRDTIKEDNIIVNGLAILAVAVVIAIAFRSISLPLLLVLTIEISIWINLAIPYFGGTNLNYIGYLIVSTVQLGATVDYGILLTQHYMDNRQIMGRKEASEKSVTDTAASLIAPGFILAAAGFVLSAVSSITVVGELGLVLGRGALLSLFMVIFLLPNLLRILERFIEKTTLKANFLPDRLIHRKDKQELTHNEQS